MPATTQAPLHSTLAQTVPFAQKEKKTHPSKKKVIKAFGKQTERITLAA